MSSAPLSPFASVIVNVVPRTALLTVTPSVKSSNVTDVTPDRLVISRVSAVSSSSVDLIDRFSMSITRPARAPDCVFVILSVSVPSPPSSVSALESVSPAAAPR